MPSRIEALIINSKVKNTVKVLWRTGKMEEPGTIQRTALNSIQSIYTIAGQQSPRKHPAINLCQSWKMLDEGLVNS